MEIDVVADPEHIRQLEVVILGRPESARFTTARITQKICPIRNVFEWGIGSGFTDALRTQC